MIRVLVATVLFLLPMISWASPANFIQQRRSVMQGLKHYGIFPRVVLNEMAAVKIQVSDSFKNKGSGTRDSAFYDFRKHLVVLNARSEFSGDLTVLIVHELLGATGRLDVNYENSVMASSLLQDARAPFLTESVRRSYRSQLAKMKKGGKENYSIRDSGLIDESNRQLDTRADGSGVVLVGGGGSEKAARIKRRVAEKFNHAWASNPAFQRKTYRSVVLGLKVEVVPSRPFKKRVRVKSILLRAKGYYERVFFVPPEMSEEQAARDIWFFVSYLGTLGSSSNALLDFYVPRNSIEMNRFRENPREFEPRGR